MDRRARSESPKENSSEKLKEWKKCRNSSNSMQPLLSLSAALIAWLRNSSGRLSKDFMPAMSQHAIPNWSLSICPKSSQQKPLPPLIAAGVRWARNSCGTLAWAKYTSSAFVAISIGTPCSAANVCRGTRLALFFASSSSSSKAGFFFSVERSGVTALLSQVTSDPLLAEPRRAVGLPCLGCFVRLGSEALCLLFAAFRSGR
mmetsp:Transcript_96170/g.170707  ORF Transcript_96170/g.170707 Transcript_96170/m.170707 type:complete len:202 (-) Transcript_96170:499-1104(-)